MLKQLTNKHGCATYGLQAVMVLNLAIEGDKAFARATGGVVESKFFLNRRVDGTDPWVEADGSVRWIRRE